MGAQCPWLPELQQAQQFPKIKCLFPNPILPSTNFRNLQLLSAGEPTSSKISLSPKFPPFSYRDTTGSRFSATSTSLPSLPHLSFTKSSSKPRKTLKALYLSSTGSEPILGSNPTLLPTLKSSEFQSNRAFSNQLKAF